MFCRIYQTTQMLPSPHGWKQLNFASRGLFKALTSNQCHIWWLVKVVSDALYASVIFAILH